MAEIKDILQCLIMVCAKSDQTPDLMPRPETAMDRVKKRIFKRKKNKLLAYALPHEHINDEGEAHG